MESVDAVEGAILGCAVGDAIGLPYEGLSKSRGIRLLGAPDRHRFIVGRGMVSDDTEHTCMVAQALCKSPTNPEEFARHLSRQFRWWLLGVPAGIGFATLRATLKLWLGFPPSRSGVFSAGNGPAMRSAVLGAVIDDLEVLRLFVKASTRITHVDPKAYLGALAIAVAAWCSRRGLTTPGEFLEQYLAAARADSTGEFDALLTKVQNSLAAGESTNAFAEQLGCKRGVSGYVYQTVPVVLHCWLSHPRDYPQAVGEVIRCGGDTDTTAAIVGSVVGSGVGREGIPAEWLNGLWEWPRSTAWMKELAKTTSIVKMTGEPMQPPPVLPVVGVGRNAFFFAVVLLHIMRRWLPPY